MIKTEIEDSKRLLHTAKELGNRRSEGLAYINLGKAYYRLCDYKKAIECSVQGLSIAKELEDRAVEADAYSGLGKAYLSLGNFKQAIEYFLQGLSIAKELRQRYEEGIAYGDLGRAHWGLGDFKQAIEYHNHCLSISKELGKRVLEGAAYCNLGCVYDSLGDFRLAIEYYTKYLSIAKDLRKRHEEGTAYGNLGNAYHFLGDFKRAIDYQNKRLNIAKELGDRHGKGSAYGNLGNTYRSMGDFKKAVVYHDGHLSIARELGERDREGRACGNLGRDYLLLGDFEQAIQYHKEQLRIAIELGKRDEEALAYYGLGNVHHSLGDFQQAIKYHKKHLSIAKELGQKDGEAGAYTELGNDYYNQCDYQQAVKYHKKSICMWKGLGQRYNEGNSSYFLGRDFELLGDLHEALNYYQYSVKLFDDVRALLQSEDVLKISFRDVCRYSYTALWTILVRLLRIDEALCVAEQGRAQALADLMNVQYGSALLARGLFEGKKEIPDILSYTSAQTVFVALTGESIYFWIIRKASPVQFRHKNVEDEDALTFLERLRKGVFKENKITARVACEDRSLDDLRNRLPPSRESSQETKTSNDNSISLRLFHDTFIGPIADLLEGDELIIIPDGPLCLAPFAAFLDGKSRYLSQSIRTRIFPSLTSLRLIANSAEDYHETSGVLLVGDPCLEKYTDLVGKPIFSPLPCARKEVEMIGEMLGVPPLTGKEATKEEVLRQIGSVALVHIAAHGDMEAGEIALAPNPTATSNIRKEKDFMLKMADVQALQLRARLVVLSCCHSARGRVMPEGVVGIGRAFLGAGARSVLVSLWAIDDEATMEFMKSFYKHLRDGNCASVAVNRARKFLRESEKFGAVKYWAPFVLIGDDVTIDFGKSQNEQC